MPTHTVQLVTADDQPAGEMEKLEAHQQGRLHRAFSIFITDSAGRVLLQRRAMTKYHSGGLWTNAACGHPAPGQPTIAEAETRLQEEMGFTTQLRTAFTFHYRAELDAGMTEHEVDHVLIGEWNGAPQPDPAEVMHWRWSTPEEISNALKEFPEAFTAWFGIAWPRALAALSAINLPR